MSTNTPQFELWLYWDDDQPTPICRIMGGTLQQLESFANTHKPQPDRTYEIVYPNGRLRSRLSWKWER